MKKSLYWIVGLTGIVALSACGPAAEGDPDKAMVLDHADVVIDAATEESSDAAAPADPAAPPPPGGTPEGLVAAETGLTDEDRMARMTPAEKAAFKEEMQGIWDSAKGEEQTHSVLIGDIQQAVEDYHFDNLKPPTNLGQLYQGGYIGYLPKIPAGKKLKIDGKSLKVTIE